MTIEDFLVDFDKLDEFDIIKKYLYGGRVWYFENYLNLSGKDYEQAVDDFNYAVSSAFDVDYKGIQIIGSGKIGFSLSPYKYLAKFDSNTEKLSDLDIAIISDSLFTECWVLMRKYSSLKGFGFYKQFSSGIYRGFIPSVALDEVPDLRKNFSKKSDSAVKELQYSVGVRHQINYRVYRSWKDFEDYHYLGLKKIKRQMQ